MNRIIRRGFYQWPRIYTIMPKIQLLVRYLSNLIVDIIPVSCSKKMLTLNPDQYWWVNYYQSFRNLWPSITKIFFTLKSLRNKLTIKEFNSRAIPLMTKFGWTVNISRSSKINSWKLSFLGRFESYIPWGSKRISWRFPKSKKFMIFFTYHSLSRIL